MKQKTEKINRNTKESLEEDIRFLNKMESVLRPFENFNKINFNYLNKMIEDWRNELLKIYKNK